MMAVENAIITHGHADHARIGHKNVLATQNTIDIMKIRYGDKCAGSFQSIEYHKPLKINNLKRIRAHLTPIVAVKSATDIQEVI